MKSWFMIILVFVVVASFLGSCKGPFVPIEDSPGSKPLQHTKRIVILDKKVRNALLYINSVQRRLAGGQIHVQANFQNSFPNGDIWAETKLEFLDENNMLVDQTEWVNTYFPAWEVTMIEGNSISGKALKHVILFKNLKTKNGKLPGTFGKILEVPWFPSVLPK